MNEEIKKGLIRLANHLELRGHKKIAEELEDVAEEGGLSSEDRELELEKDQIVQDLDLAYFAKDICDEINKMLDESGGDQSSVADDLAYSDISSSEYTMLEDMAIEMIMDTFGSEIEKDEAEDCMHRLVSRYDFIENLHEDSFDDLCEIVEEDIERLEG